jgi:hypothetical protein
MKRSEIVISPEGGLVFEPPVVVFELEEGVPLGALACWVEPPAGPEGAAVDCEMEPVGAGVKPMLEDIESERGGQRCQGSKGRGGRDAEWAGGNKIPKGDVKGKRI